VTSIIVSSSADLPAGTSFPWIADGFAYGADYNPEQWPEEVWQEDVALMRRAGVNSVSLGVFSWGLIETADGVYDFGWLDRIMDLLHGHGVGVNLATPTAAPPIWLLQEHPEIAPVTEVGVRLSQGGRLGWYPSSATFRQYALRIVEKVALRYGTHPALRMWHVGNELGNENNHSYDDETGAAWQLWLRAKFGTTQTLNHAWGSAVWGHHYTSFEQIQPPRYTSTGHNPALLLDFERFTSDALLGHYRAERDVLRGITPNIPITTNFMVQRSPGVADYPTWAGEVDLVANDHYTLGADPERYGELAFSADRVRGISGGDPWLLIEHSTSAVSWQRRNLAKSPGELTRNSLSHIARGADGALFFQWRQSASGAEQFHSSVVPHAGAQTKVFAEVEAFGALLSRIAEVVGSRVAPARVAILFDSDSAAALRCGAKPSVDINGLDVALTFHRELTSRGVAVDIIHPSTALDGYAALIVPTLFLISDDNAAAIADFATRGGHVVITAFSGIVTQHNRVRLGGYPGAFLDLLGVRFEEILPLLEHEALTLDNGWAGSVWSELGQTTTAQVVASYTEGDLVGRPAVTARTLPASGAAAPGTATYVSTVLNRASTGALIDDLLARAGVEPVAAGDRGLERIRRTDGSRSWLFAINHGPCPLRVTVTGLDLVCATRAEGAAVIPAGSVAVFREDI
jgi:beta-galactosidase